MKDKIYDYLTNNEVSIDRDIYDYGYSYLKQYLIFLIILIPTVLYLNIVNATIIFLVFYFPLRRCVGGYHFDSNVMCLLFSFIITIVCALLSTSIQITYFFYLLTQSLIILLIILFAPVDHRNKRLNINEKNIYKNKSIKIELIYLAISIFFKNSKIIPILFFVNIINSLSIILGHYYNKL